MPNVFVVIDGDKPCTVHDNAASIVADIFPRGEDAAVRDRKTGALEFIKTTTGKISAIRDIPVSKSETFMFFDNHSNTPTRIIRVLHREVIAHPLLHKENTK